MRLLLPLIFALSVSGTAFAKTPPEVLKPYKQYKQALEKDDKKNAAKYALEAWEAAEEELGDHKLTGDLAYNYAIISSQGKKVNLRRRRAFSRSIALASLYPDETAHLIEIERRVELAEMRLNIDEIKDLEKAIKKHNMVGSVFDAEKEALYARLHALNEDHSDSLRHAENAIRIFEATDSKIFSKYLYYARLFRGNSLSALDRKIDAALEYQGVMQNLEGDLPAEHHFIKRSFQKWMKTRSDIENAGLLEKAEQSGLCECWPFENYKDQPTPLERKPPIMPVSAKNSGHVYIQYDLDPQGNPINLVQVSSTAKLFEKPAIESVKKWTYSKAESDADPESRKNLVTKISFRLTDENGNVIPE